MTDVTFKPNPHNYSITNFTQACANQITPSNPLKIPVRKHGKDPQKHGSKNKQDFLKINNMTEEPQKFIRHKRKKRLSFDNIIDELPAVSNETYELIDRLALIISYLLRWQYDIRGPNWVHTIKEKRDQARSYIEDNPSLKSMLDEILTGAYKVGVLTAEQATRIDQNDFPSECPYTFEQIMDDEFYPE